MLVLWVMVLLTAIATEFAFTMRTEVNITKNFKEETEAYYAALAGFEQAKAEILLAQRQMYLDEEGMLLLGEKKLTRRNSLGNATFSYAIIDEDRKMNLNTSTPNQLRYILKNSGIEDTELDTILDSIFDWRDRDSFHRLNGAEEDFYQSLPMPYSCKDGPFDIVEELVLVKGITPEMLFGSKEGSKMKGFYEYFTTKSSNRINVNTADRIVLEARFGIAVAENILMQRSAGPILAPMAGGVVESSYFTVIATGKSGKTKRVIKAIIRKKTRTSIETLYWNDNWLFDPYLNTDMYVKSLQ